MTTTANSNYLRRSSFATVRLLLFFIFVTLFVHSGAQNNSPKHTVSIPSHVRKILFLGNSITYAGTFITEIETYLITEHPGLKIEFINAGLPSETVSGLSEEGHAGGAFPRPDLHERLQRVLDATKPQLIFACYGMNDGIYLPLDEERFRKYKDGITWLHNMATKNGADIVHVTPPVFDERQGGHAGYGHVLDTYSAWLVTQKSMGWKVADVHNPMKQFLDRHREADSTFALAEDGVHPGATGHWIMTKAILEYLNVSVPQTADGLQSILKDIRNGNEIYALVAQRQAFMKDAWLTYTGHTRPGMKTGLPMAEAKKKALEIDRQIRRMLRLKG